MKNLYGILPVEEPRIPPCEGLSGSLCLSLRRKMVSVEKLELPEAQAEEERRYLPRWEIFNTWEICNQGAYTRGNDTTTHSCHTRDINFAGVCICANEDLPINEKINLTIFLAQDITPIEAFGRVVWRSVCGQERYFGVHFEQISRKAQDSIFDFILQYKREELLKRWFGTV